MQLGDVCVVHQMSLVLWTKLITGVHEAQTKALPSSRDHMDQHADGVSV
jgi:hypothetical protein